jgi:hypothetical protein
MSKPALPLFLLLTLGACATAPVPTNPDTVPSWVNRPETLYPQTRYLSAVGGGKNREEAIQDAKRQLAESFVVKVQSQSRINSDSSLNQNTEGAISGRASQKMEKETTFETQTNLRGAEIKEVASVGAQTYALIALDKLSARSGLLMEANRIQSALNLELDSLEERFSTTNFAKAKELYGSLETLHAEAAVLGMSALFETSPSRTRLDRIESGMRGRNAKKSFVVEMKSGDQGFAKDLESCINDRGGQVFDPGKADASVNRIEVSINERPQHMSTEGWTKIRFDLSASIIEGTGRKFQAKVSETETGRSKAAVLEAVSDKLAKALCDQVFNRIGEMSP